jgi:hypothetical protein
MLLRCGYGRGFDSRRLHQAPVSGAFVCGRSEQFTNHLTRRASAATPSLEGVTIAAPAVCDSCGAIFPSGIAFGPDVRGITMRGNKSGPCPKCGGMGSIPDGVYNVLDDTLNIVSTWAPDRVAGVLANLQTARSAANPLEATQAVLSESRELSDIASRLLVPRNSADFWAFVAALMAILVYLQH